MKRRTELRAESRDAVVGEVAAKEDHRVKEEKHGAITTTRGMKELKEEEGLSLEIEREVQVSTLSPSEDRQIGRRTLDRHHRHLPRHSIPLSKPSVQILVERVRRRLVLKLLRPHVESPNNDVM